MGDFVVGIHKDDVFAGGVPEGQPLAFLHVFAVVVQDDGPKPPGNLARAVSRMRVGQDDLDFIARISLAGKGGKAVFQNRLGIQRGHDDADAREISRGGRHWEWGLDF